MSEGTRRLYYEDPELVAFDAAVLGQSEEGGRWAVVLDRTAFYPEGGGQPADRGTLNGTPVLDVQLRGEEVVHLVAGPLRQERVRGELDAARRFDYTQQHTGQHLVSGALLEAAGARTVSAYLGETYTATELEEPELADERILAAEELANRIILENRPVRAHWVGPEDVGRFPLRKLPPVKEKIRILEIDGFDFSPCGGTHLDRTGRIGLVRWVASEKIRGRLRLHWKIGLRALADYRLKDEVTARLSRELTCGVEDLPETVGRLKERLRGQGAVQAALEGRLAAALAEGLAARARPAAGRRLVVHRSEGESAGVLRAVLERLTAAERTVAVLLNREGERLQWMVGQGSGAGLDLEETLAPLLPIIGGRGGGSATRRQGVGSKPAGADELIRKLEQTMDGLPPLP